MSRFWKMAGIAALITVLVVAAVAVVSAQEPTPTPGTGNKVANLWQRMHEAIAKALGITVEQYDSAIDTARDDVLEQAIEEGLLTQEQADRLAEKWQDGWGPMGMPQRGMHGRGFGGRDWGMMGVRGDSLLSVAAEKLGLTVEQLVDELQNDQTIADVAQAKGVDLQAIVDAYLAPREERLQKLVADERITQAQADEMLADMREEAQGHLEESYPFGCDGERGEHMPEDFRFGPGGRRGGNSPSDTPEEGRFRGMSGGQSL